MVDGGSMKLDEIILGDCLTVMEKMEDCCIDLTVTSPPYDNLREYLGHSEFDFQGIAKQLYRITKIGGVVVWIVADATINGSETGTSFRQALYFMEVGFNLHDTMIYIAKGTGAKGSIFSYWQGFEYMFVFSKGKPKTINLIKDVKNATVGLCSRGGRHRKDGSVEKNHKTLEFGIRTNVWAYNVGFMDQSDSTGHPAPFPEKLAAEHIISWSNPGDLILDPFAGSGTTCKMAKLHNRHFIGIEINPEYVDICNKRLSQEVFDFG
jgi:site-specific DNA-methyltransferase (adenine-specific)